MQDRRQRIIMCQVGTHTVSVFLGEVRSIQRASSLRRNKDSAEPYAFLVTTDGDIPVISLADRLGVKSALRMAAQRVLVMENAQGMWGLLVDRTQQVSAESDLNLFPVPPDVVNPKYPYFKSIVEVNEQLSLMLNLDALLVEPLPTASGKRAANGTSSQAGANAMPSLEDRAAKSNQLNERGGQLLTFEVPGVEGYTIGLSTLQVAEVVSASNVLPVPRAPMGFLGCVNWRGTLVPLVDLANRLGLRKEQHTIEQLTERRILIMRERADGAPLGYFIHSRVQLLRLPIQYKLAPQDKWPETEKVEALLQLPNQTVLVPHPNFNSV